MKFNIKRILITRASYSLPPQPVIKCFRFMLSTVHRTPLLFSPLFSPQQFIKWCAFHGWSAGNIKRQLKTILPRGSSKCIRYRFRNFPSSERSIRARHLGESRESKLRGDAYTRRRKGEPSSLEWKVSHSVASESPQLWQKTSNRKQVENTSIEGNENRVIEREQRDRLLPIHVGVRHTSSKDDIAAHPV